MSQQDVIDILKKYPKGLSSKEIHMILKKKGIDLGLSTVTVNLQRLTDGNNFVVRFYSTQFNNKPKYVLKENVTKGMRFK